MCFRTRRTPPSRRATKIVVEAQLRRLCSCMGSSHRYACKYVCVCLCVGARARLGWLSPCNNRLCWLFRRCLSLSAWIPQLCDSTTAGVTLYIASFSFSGAERGSVFTFELESAQNGFSRPTCQRRKIARSGRKSMPGQKGGKCIYNSIYLMRKEINRGPRDPCEREKDLRVKEHSARACLSRTFSEVSAVS
jgi:hypothetical protein